MKKGALLLLKNEFKQSLRNKVQLVGLIFLILLVSTIFSVMRSTTVRVVDQYEILNKDSNLHDFIIDLDNSEIRGKNENDDSYDFLKQDAIENAAHNPENRFYWARIETRTFSLSNNGQQRLLKAIAYDKKVLIDKLIVTEGKNIGEDETVAKKNQVVLNKEFAENNGIKIGSVIRLQADDKGESLLVSHDSKIINDPINSNFNWFKVVGVGVSADFTMTKIDQTTIIPNKTREGLVYVDPLQFGLVKRDNYRYKESKNSFWDYDKTQEMLTITSNKDREVYFAGKFYDQKNTSYVFPKNQVSEKVVKLSNQLKGEEDKWWIKTDPFEKWNDYNVYDLLQNINIEKDTIRQNQLQNQKIIEEQLVNSIKQIFKKQQNDNLKWDNSWTIKFFYKDISGKEIPFDFTARNIDITNSIKIGFQVLANNNSNNYEDGNVFASEKMEVAVAYNPGNFVEHDSNKNIEEDIYKLVKNYGYDENGIIIPKISSSYLRKGSNQNTNNIKNEIVKNLITSLNQKAVYSFDEVNTMQDFLENNLNVTVAETDGNVLNERINTDQELKRKLKITLSLYGDSTAQQPTDIDVEVSFKKNITKSFYSTIDRSEKLVYSLFDPSYQYNSRVSSLNSTIKGYKRLMELLLVLTMTIASITLALVIRKAIDNSKVQIGILKSLGYSNGKILITSLTYPMIGSFCSALLTYFTSLPLQKLVIKIFSQYYNLDFGAFYFSWLSFLYTIILTFGFLSLVALIVTLIAIWKKPIDLIKYDANSTTSWMARKIKFVVRKRKFKTRFKVAMFSSSIGKISAVSVTMLLGTVLMTGSIIGPKIMKDNMKSTYDGLKYNSIVEYESPIYNSPLSFYKTYNPNTPAWGNEINRGSLDPAEMKDADIRIINEILDNNINSEYYSPYYDKSVPGATMTLGMNITHFPWKGFTSSFLEELSNNSDKAVAMFVNKMAWPDYASTLDAFSKVSNLSDNKINALTYDQFRNFYRTYHSTIGLDIQKQLRANNSDSSAKKAVNNLFNKDELKKFIKEIKDPDSGDFLPLEDADPAIDSFSFEEGKFRIKDDIDFLNKPSSYFKNQEIMKNWIKKFTIWFVLLFYNNTGQSITQGVYTKAPYFVRQQMSKSFKDKKSFNIFFNVIPFDKTTDELGTYFEVNPSGNKDFTFKTYGIQNDSKYIELTNEAGENLNQKIIGDYTLKDDVPVNMIVNETVAQKLNLKPNDIVQWDINSNEMIKTPSTLNPNPVTSREILNSFSIPKYDDSGGSNPRNSNMFWSFTNMKNEHLVPSSEALYNPELMGNLSTGVNKEVSQGNIAIDRFTAKQKFKIVDIHKGYGDPKAYIAKDVADKLLKYNLSKEKLFEIFANQWSGHEVDLPNSKNYRFQDYAKNPASEEINKDVWDLSKFQEKALKDPNSPEADILKIFNNEYPVFNFKVSSVKEIDKIADVTSGFTTYQAYGDFTQLGLNGGIDPNDKINYSGYGKGAAKFILPLSVHREILDQITSLSNLILILFAALALMVSFIIILLTSNLIIYENRKTIATMKVLGYSDRKITNILIGMYLPILVITFIAGFVSGWYIIKLILAHLALNTSWVLPLVFAWWLPVIVGAIVLGMYVLTFIAGWFSMKRINPIYALKVND